MRHHVSCREPSPSWPWRGVSSSVRRLQTTRRNPRLTKPAHHRIAQDERAADAAFFQIHSDFTRHVDAEGTLDTAISKAVSLFILASPRLTDNALNSAGPAVAVRDRQFRLVIALCSRRKADQRTAAIVGGTNLSGTRCHYDINVERAKWRKLSGRQFLLH